MTASPCLGICKINPLFAICHGCYRNKLEIKRWHSFSEEEKQQVVDNCKDREQLYGELI